jgi:hypothetical protein
MTWEPTWSRQKLSRSGIRRGMKCRRSHSFDGSGSRPSPDGLPGAGILRLELVGVLTEVAPAAPTARDILLFETVLFFLVGGLYGIPGTLLWLLLVAAFPPEWSTLRRRAAALTMSPIIQVIWLTWFISEHAYLAAAIFGLFLPAGSALVVRLRGRAPSSPWPPDDGWSVSSSGAGPGTSRTRSGGRRGSGSRRPS